MDKHTKETIEKVQKSLDRANGQLGHLVSVADELRERERQAVNQLNGFTEKDYATVGKILAAASGDSLKDRADKPKGKWYRNIGTWKKILESIGIVSAIAYAIVTYLQWRDLQHNFFVEQKSWAKYQVVWPLDLASNSTVGVNITNTGKIPMLSSVVAGHIEVIPDNQPARMPDGNHPVNLDFHSFLFPNDNFVYVANLYDEKSRAARQFTDNEVRDLREGRSYVAIFGLIKYQDELGSHWLRFCDWHNYAPNTISNALDCVSMNKSGDGEPKDH